MRNVKKNRHSTRGYIEADGFNIKTPSSSLKKSNIKKHISAFRRHYPTHHFRIKKRKNRYLVMVKI